MSAMLKWRRPAWKLSVSGSSTSSYEVSFLDGLPILGALPILFSISTDSLSMIMGWFSTSVCISSRWYSERAFSKWLQYCDSLGLMSFCYFGSPSVWLLLVSNAGLPSVWPLYSSSSYSNRSVEHRVEDACFCGWRVYCDGWKFYCGGWKTATANGGCSKKTGIGP